MSKGLNVCVFSGLQVTNTWKWNDGSLVARCQMAAPGGGFSFITLVIRNGDTLGLKLHKGQVVSVQRAQVRSRDLPESLTTTFQRAGFDLDGAMKAAGLDDDQSSKLREAFEKGTLTRVMTEFLVDPNDLIVD